MENTTSFTDPTDQIPGHNPEFIWLGCSDARVPERFVDEQGRLIADETQIFVHRNVANQFQLSDPNAGSAVAFGVTGLSVKRLLVVGHTHCAGVAAAYNEAKKENGIRPSVLATWMQPLVDYAKKNCYENAEQLAVGNVRLQVQQLKAFIEALREEDGVQVPSDITVEGYMFDIADGKLKPVSSTESSKETVEPTELTAAISSLAVN